MNAKQKTREQLSAYLDGELSPTETDDVARALEADEELRRELTELAAVRDLLRSLPAEHAPDHLAGSVLAEAERSQLVGAAESKALPGTLRWVRYLATAAVLLMAVTVGTIIAVTLWSPPRPDYETHLAHRRERGEPAGVTTKEAAGRRLGTETSAARGSGRGRTGGERSWHLDVAGTDANATRGLVGGTVRLAAKNGHGGGKDLVKDVGDLRLALAQAAENNEIIFTDHMALTLRGVEKVLLANGIQPMVVKESTAAAYKQPDAQARANVFRQSQLSARQVQYEAWVTPEQMPEVQKQIRGIRAGQRVSQEMLARAPKGGVAGRSYGRTEWGTSARQEESRERVNLKKLGKSVTGKLMGDSRDSDEDAEAADKLRSPKGAPAVPAVKPTPEPVAKPAAKPHVAPATAGGDEGLSPRRRPRKAGPGYFPEEANGKKKAEDLKREETLQKGVTGAGIAKVPGPAPKPAPPPKPAAEPPTEDDLLAAGRRTPKRVAATQDKSSEAKPTGTGAIGQAEVEPDARDDQERRLRELGPQTRRVKAGRPHPGSGSAKVGSGEDRRGAGTYDYANAPAEPKRDRGGRAAPEEHPATRPPEALPAVPLKPVQVVQVKTANGGQVASEREQKTGLKTVTVDELTKAAEAVQTILWIQNDGMVQSAGRSILATAATRPTTQAGAVTAQHRQLGGLPRESEEYALEKFQQIDLSDRAQRYYGQAQGATSQQAAARLRRLLITVNFRSVVEADRAASMGIRAKEAAKTAPAPKE